MIAPDLMKKFGYKSVMQVPRIEKIVLNMGVGEAVGDKKIMDNAVGDMHQDRRPEAGGHHGAQVDRDVQDPQGLSGRLHGDPARHAHVRVSRSAGLDCDSAHSRLPRHLRRRSFDGRGNFNMGVKEQIIFPEIEYDKIDAMRGMNISIATTARTDDEARALLAGFNFPFRN